jgi:hypothetical protein
MISTTSPARRCGLPGFLVRVPLPGDGDAVFPQAELDVINVNTIQLPIPYRRLKPLQSYESAFAD